MPAVSPHRKRRGADTARIGAAYLVDNGFPWATDAGAGRRGADILGTPGLSWEFKARRDFSPLAWLRQADRSPGLAVCVFRPDGMGEASVEQWGMLLRFGDGVPVLRAAGYGDPP